MKLVKRQINGEDEVVLKEPATEEDLRAEAARLRAQLGYDVQPDSKPRRFIATHGFYRGKFLLALEND